MKYACTLKVSSGRMAGWFQAGVGQRSPGSNFSWLDWLFRSSSMSHVAERKFGEIYIRRTTSSNSRVTFVPPIKEADCRFRNMVPAADCAAPLRQYILSFDRQPATVEKFEDSTCITIGC